eukprot:m.139343 g.139343  ORF g.139343 m.139343 type:complete len:146 (-) comp17057_c0_seq3:600-1037(-)
MKAATQHAATTQPCHSHRLSRVSSLLSQCELRLAPSLDSYPGGKDATLALKGDHHRWNASLALQLAHTWLCKQGVLTAAEGTSGKVAELPTTVDSSADGVALAPSFTVSPLMQIALASCVWPGRSQVRLFNFPHPLASQPALLTV